MHHFDQAIDGHLDPFYLVLEGSIPNEAIKDEGYWAIFGDEALRENAERMKVLSRRLIEVQEAERRYVALELHDEIGQILTGLKLTLEMGARLPGDEARQSIAQAQTMVNQLLALTRKLSIDLRPTTLDHLGLLSALWWHIRHYTSQA
jgi:signal transduction histidine kinase